MPFKYLGVDINENNCCISAWIEGIPLIIAKANYEKPLKNQKETIGPLNFTKWNLTKNHEKDLNYNNFVRILKWCNLIIEESFPHEEIRCIVSTPSLINRLQKMSLEQAIEESDLCCLRTRDKSSCALLNENFIHFARNSYVLTLHLSLNYIDAVIAEIGDGVLECLGKLSCIYDNTNFVEKKESVSNLIKYISFNLVDPSKFEYVYVTGESHVFEELKSDIAKSTYRKDTTLIFDMDGSAKGLAIEAGILEGSINDVLLLDIVSYKINVLLNVEGDNNSIVNIPLDDSFPIEKSSVHLQCCDFSNLLTIEQVNPFIKGHQLFSKSSAIEAFDIIMHSKELNNNHHELVEIIAQVDNNSRLSFILKSDVSDLIENVFSRKSREELLELGVGTSQIIQAFPGSVSNHNSVIIFLGEITGGLLVFTGIVPAISDLFRIFIGIAPIDFTTLDPTYPYRLLGGVLLIVLLQRLPKKSSARRS